MISNADLRTYVYFQNKQFDLVNRVFCKTMYLNIQNFE